MDVVVRTETPADYAAVADVVRSAFAEVGYSDHREHLLVARLRASRAFVPLLAIVALAADEIVGHIMFTEVAIDGENGSTSALALAPLSVVPAFQRQGVGARLIDEGHRRAARLGFRSVVLLGDARYYARFGYEPASRHGITFPFDVRDENRMVRALTQHGLDRSSGRVVYPPEF